MSRRTQLSRRWTWVNLSLSSDGWGWWAPVPPAPARPLQSRGRFQFLFDRFDILRPGLTLWTKLASNSLTNHYRCAPPCLPYLCVLCAYVHAHMCTCRWSLALGVAPHESVTLFLADRALKLASWAPLAGYNVSGICLPHLSALGFQAGATTPDFLQWCLGLWPTGP